MSIEEQQIQDQQQESNEQSNELGAQAKYEYEQKNYEACLRYVEKLIDENPSNVKLVMNKAICEYALTSFKLTSEFKHKLFKICSQLKIDLEDLQTLESNEYCIIYYNYAILLFNYKLFKKSLIIIEKILEFVDSLDDNLIREVFLLAIDLYLKTYQPEQALNTIVNYEKQYSTRFKNDNDQLILAKFKIECDLQMKRNINDKDFQSLVGINKNDLSIILLQANNEYSTRNFQKSLEILTYLLKTSQLITHLNNNIGCVHFNVKKYGLSSFYYRRALSDTSSGMSQYELIFNLGLSLLFNKQPLSAFDCFIDVIAYYKFNSRLWLRIAECCILAYRSQNDSICKLSEKIKCIQKSIGINIYHKLVFASSLSKQSSQQTSSLATLEFAYMCLRNALVLLPQFEDIQQDTGTKLFNSFQPSNALSLNQLKSLKCSILISIAYVSISLNDYSNTIKYCKTLLNECNSYLSKGNRYLALQYLSEALYYSDRVNDSIEKLNNALDEQNEFDISFDLKTSSTHMRYDTNNWYPRDNDTAKAILFYNLAVSQATRGDIEASYKSFDQCVKLFGNQHPVNVFHMKIYLNLLDGNRGGLQTFLKDYFGHATINRSYQPYIPTKPTPIVNPQQQQQQQQFNQPMLQPQQTPPINIPTSLSNLLLQQQQQQQQQQQIPANLLQQQAQLLQLAQQQQYFNQLNSLTSPLGFNSLPNFGQQSPSAAITPNQANTSQTPFSLNQQNRL